MFLFLIFSFFCHGIELAPTLVGSDNVRFAKYMEAVKEAEKVVNSKEFKIALMSLSFTSTDDDGIKVLYKMEEGAELLLPDKNRRWDWSVGFYRKKASRVIGWTNQNILTVWVNTARFDYMDTPEIVANIVHEYLHKLGYGHKSAKDHNSVPYKVGYLAESYCYEPNVITQSKPRRSLWSRIKSGLRTFFGYE